MVDLDTLVSLAKEHGFIVLDFSSQKFAKIGLLNERNIVTIWLTIKQDLTWELRAFQRDILDGPFFEMLPSVLTVENIDNVLGELKSAKICIGNNDFKDLIEHKVEGFGSFLPKGHLEDEQLNVLTTTALIIRSAECSVVPSSNHGPDRCEFCSKHRKTLLNVNRKLPT